MAAPSFPYNIILAGKYGVGKSSLFDFLSERVETIKSPRGWDKCPHVMNVGAEVVQVSTHRSGTSCNCVLATMTVIGGTVGYGQHGEE